MASSFNWWAKESHRGTPMVVKMENPNWSMVELEGLDEEELIPDSGRNIEARPGKERKAVHLGFPPQSPQGYLLPHFPHFSNHWVGRSCPPPHCLRESSFYLDSFEYSRMVDNNRRTGMTVLCAQRIKDALFTRVCVAISAKKHYGQNGYAKRKDLKLAMKFCRCVREVDVLLLNVVAIVNHERRATIDSKWQVLEHQD